MQGDFSRDTFDLRHRFSRVLMQQGRVLVDADWNEQTSILLHYLRALAADVIGAHGGPRSDAFKIGCTDELTRDFTIGYGRYYVNGILCENLPPDPCPTGDPDPLLFTEQPHYPWSDEDPIEVGQYLVYLDVWEQHVTHLQVPSIREVGLGGPDTSTRARVVWQVRSQSGRDLTCDNLPDLPPPGPLGCLSARARVDELSDDPCIIPPEARYRGAENQLYRVEIHDGSDAGEEPTFKWSRDNGAVAMSVREVRGDSVVLDTLGPDDRLGLKEGDWVELLNDRLPLGGRPGVFARVDEVDRLEFRVTLSPAAGHSLSDVDSHPDAHALLRRWDQGGAPHVVVEGEWIPLEDGVEVKFEDGGAYRTGDYWLIPTRTATGDVLWPSETTEDGTVQPTPRSPHGIEHHYAPLGIITVASDGSVTCDHDCRCLFDPLCADAARLPTDPRDERADDPVRGTTAELTDIRGVGPSRAERLIAAGHRTPADVAEMSVEEIVRITGVTTEVARGIRESAIEVARRRG